MRAKVYFEADVVKKQDANGKNKVRPYLFELAMDVYAIFQPRNVKAYFIENEADKPWITLVTVNIQNFAISQMGKSLANPSNMLAIRARNLAAYDAAYIRLIQDAVGSLKYKVNTVVQGADDFGAGMLWETSAAAKALKATKEAHDRALILKAAQEMAGTLVPSANRLKSEEDEGARALKRERDTAKASLSGDILVPKDGGPLTCPSTFTDPEDIPCLGHLRLGGSCAKRRKGKFCKFNHTAIKDLSPEKQQAWLAHLKTIPGAKFNKKTVKCFPADQDMLAEPSEEYYTIPRKRSKK